MPSKPVRRRFPATLLPALLLVPGVACHAADEHAAFSMQIMDVFKITGRGVVMTGRVASGTIAVGDTVCVPLGSGETVARTVDGIEQFRKLLESAKAGDSVGLLVAGVDDDDVEKGAALHADCRLDPETDSSVSDDEE